MASESRFVTFCLQGLWFGVVVESVQEIVCPLALTVVPLAPEVAGLFNLRGRIVTAIDLGRHLGLRPASPRGSGLHVVLRHGAETVSFPVDEIGEVVDTAGLRFEPPPSTLSPQSRGLVDGVYEFPRRLLHVLALMPLLATEGAMPGQLTPSQPPSSDQSAAIGGNLPAGEGRAMS